MNLHLMNFNSFLKKSWHVFKFLMCGWLVPSVWIVVGISYALYLKQSQPKLEISEWLDCLIPGVFLPLLWLMFKFLIAIGEIETPSMTRERKRKEAEQEAAEKNKYQNLSEEGKILYELNKNQKRTEENTRVLLGMIMGGAVGYLVFYFWPF